MHNRKYYQTVVELSIPVDITQGLIEYLEEGEIEFLFCNPSKLTIPK